MRTILWTIVRRLIGSNWNSRSASVIALALFLLTLISSPVAAHGYIIRAIPEDRASLARAPARVQVWFSEELEPAFSVLTVRNQAGDPVAQGGVDEVDHTLMSARLPPNLPDGAYVSELRVAFASDGHVIVETRVFFIGSTSEDAAASSSDTSVQPLEVFWRTLLLAATMVMFGAFSLYSLVLIPAWGNSTYPVGNLPPRVLRRLNWIVWIALGVGFGANILALLQQSMVFFATGIDRVLSDQLWNIVRIGTRFGDTWNARMLLLIVIAAIQGGSLYSSRTQPAVVRPGWVANAWAAALLLGTWSVSSHATGSQVMPWLALLSDWLHGLAVGIWAGGAVALALVLPVALAPYTGENRRQALLAALRRFSRAATGGLIVVIATGIYNATNWFTAPADVGSAYGLTLIVKVMLAALLVAVGAAHHIAVNPERYRQWSSIASRFSEFIPSLRIESILVLVVLGAAAWLSATPPPTPEIVSPPPLTFSTSTGGRTVSLTVAPGGTGVNTYDVQVVNEADNSPIPDANVAIRLNDPARDFPTAWHAGESIDDGLYTATGADIDHTGTWWALVEVDGARAAFSLEVNTDADLLRSRPPTLLNLLALAGVVGASIFALLPILRRIYSRLDRSPAAVTIAAGATAATVLIVIVGLIASANAFQDYDRLALPAPTVVDTVLPDADSLARGQDLFAQTCTDWMGKPALDDLIKRLPRLRDQDLYEAFVNKGWRDLPSCAASLSEAQRWDLVNYVRSQEAH